MASDLTQRQRAEAIEAYVYSRIIPVTESGCWLWEGNCNPSRAGAAMTAWSRERPSKPYAHLIELGL